MVVKWGFDGELRELSRTFRGDWLNEVLRRFDGVLMELNRDEHQFLIRRMFHVSQTYHFHPFSDMSRPIVNAKHLILDIDRHRYCKYL